VKAYCTDFPPKCGFRGKFLSSLQSTFSDHLFLVNLTNIYRSALLTSEYPHLPTIGMPGTAIASLPNVNILMFLPASGRKPDLDDFVLRFQSAAPFGPGPYFEGYCGEHVSQHPGKEQRAGPFGNSGISLPMRRQSDINVTNETTSLSIINPILLVKALFEHVTAPQWTWRVQRWRCMLTLCNDNVPPDPRPQPASSKRESLPRSFLTLRWVPQLQIFHLP